MSSMVLSQDQAQASESEYIESHLEYQRQLAQYEKDKAEYDKKIAEQKALVEKKIAEEQKKKAEEEARKKAEEEAAKKKAAQIKAEKDTIYQEYQASLAANPHEPKKWGSGGRGGGHRVQYTNPAHTEYAQEQKRIYERRIATINVRESGVKVESVGPLSRSASNILRGKSAGPGNRHVQYQVGIARLNRQLYSGKVSPSQYPAKVQEIKSEYQQAQHAFTLRKAKTAATTFASQRAAGTLNADIRKAQSEELKRLGGTGSLESGADIGPTKISKTLVSASPNLANRVEVAPGTAKKSQDFSNEFKSEQEIEAQRLRENQTVIETLGLNIKADELDDLGISSIYTQGSVESGAALPSTPVAPKEPIQKYTVTSPDGKVRTFNTLETAQKFIDRTAVQKYTVTSPDGKTHTFKTQQEAQRFIDSKTEMSYVGYSSDGSAIQGPPDPRNQKWQVSTVSGIKEFTTQKEAQAFIDENPDKIKTTITVARLDGTTFELDPNADKKYYDIGGFKLSKEPDTAHKFMGKPITDPKQTEILDAIQYRIGTALAPITNIPIEINNMVTGQELETRPTVVSSLIGDSISAVVEAVKQGTLTPTLEKPVGTEAWEFVSKDPVGVVSQIPAEYVLFRLGEGVTKVGGKVFEKLPKTTQTKLTQIKTSIVKPIQRVTDTVVPRYIPQNELKYWRGITINNKPVIGVAEGKVVLGTPKPKDIPTEKFQLENRSAGELAFGFGAEKNIYYSDPALKYFQNIRFISELDRVRAQQAIKTQTTSANAPTPPTFALGEEPAKTISESQFRYLLKVAESEYVAGKIHPVHGSLSTRTHMSKELREEGGDLLKLGDLDVSPVYTKKGGEALFESEASRIIQKAAQNFPLKKGESIKVTDDVGKSRSIEFTPKDGKPVKIFEVLVKDKQSSLGQMKKNPTHVMGERVPHDTVTVVGTKLETSTLRYQFLTNLKTRTAFQSGRIPTYSLAPTIIGRDVVSVKGGLTKARIYVGEGREKDIIRSYYILRQTALTQEKAGQISLSKKTAQEAQEIKNLYPELNFDKGFSDRVAISFGSSTTNVSPTQMVSVRSIIASSTSSKSTTSEIKQQQSSVSPRTASIRSVYTSIPTSVKPSNIATSVFKNTPSKVSVASVIESTKTSTPSRIVSTSILSKPSTSIPSKPSTSIPSKPSTSIPSKSSTSIPSKPSRIVSKSIPSKPPTVPTKSIVSRPPRRILPIIDTRIPTKQRKKNKEKKNVDFLGSSRTDHIAGMFKRTEIISGDKKSAKQLSKDKKWKPNKKKKKKSKKKQDSFLQREGVISKGFKI